MHETACQKNLSRHDPERLCSYFRFRILQFNSILNAGIVENNSLPNMCEKINCKLWCRWVGFSYCKYCLSDKVAFWGENVGSKVYWFCTPKQGVTKLITPGLLLRGCCIAAAHQQFDPSDSEPSVTDKVMSDESRLRYKLAPQQLPGSGHGGRGKRRSVPSLFFGPMNTSVFI